MDRMEITEDQKEGIKKSVYDGDINIAGRLQLSLSVVLPFTPLSPFGPCGPGSPFKPL